MKKYIVEITNEALADMEQLYDYITFMLLAPDNAARQYNRIADKILTLDSFPERYMILDIDDEQIKEIRRMPVDNFSVFYVIRKNRVIVTNVLYSASSINSRLSI